MLGHPVQIRALALLGEREQAEAELAAAVGIEAPNLSQRLAMSRRANLVASRKDGSTVCYMVTRAQVAAPLTPAREIVARILGGRAGRPAEDVRSSAPQRASP
ncbi:transcriptional regulator [Dactylosporangium sp. CS-047395]|uniref:transcriptional regulator n=1 Tax=Dactylosporangium sp. CS-047395 TaxID=3239936 RepID=UPI003D8B86BE